MYLRPVPRRAQGPAIDDIADQINRFGFVVTEEVEQLVGLTAAGSQMDVGDKQRAKPSRGVVRHGAAISDATIMRDMYQRVFSVL
jgi:hypothetical protein